MEEHNALKTAVLAKEVDGKGKLHDQPKRCSASLVSGGDLLCVQWGHFDRPVGIYSCCNRSNVGLVGRIHVGGYMVQRGAVLSRDG